MKCGFCKFYEQNNQKEGCCRFNPPSGEYCDIIVKADRKGCSEFKFEQGFLYPKGEEKCKPKTTKIS